MYLLVLFYIIYFPIYFILFFSITCYLFIKHLINMLSSHMRHTFYIFRKINLSLFALAAYANIYNHKMQLSPNNIEHKILIDFLASRHIDNCFFTKLANEK